MTCITDRTSILGDSVSTPETLCWVLRWLSPHRCAVPLERDLVRLGRAPDAPVHLPDTAVSRVHAELHREGGGYVLQDLGSSNGTYLNGRRIDRSPVHPGDVLRVGHYIGTFCAAPSPRLGSGFREILPGLWGTETLAEPLAPLMQVARTDQSVLIIGETGTGKDCVARAIHTLSGRPGRFIALNCAAIPEQLAEAEFFGCRPGALGGQNDENIGHLRAAHQGTLLLDNLPDLSAPLQAKLLRVLENRLVTPLGSTEPAETNFRVVATSQTSLAEAKQSGLFRSDLLARLSDWTTELPRLRDRREDIIPLFERFFSADGRPRLCSPRFLERLTGYDWPENVREVAGLAKRLLLQAPQQTRFETRDLPEHLRPKESGPGADGAKEQRLNDLAEALYRTEGNLSAAVTRLGISRQSAYRLLEGRSPRELLDQTKRRLEHPE